MHLEILLFPIIPTCSCLPVILSPADKLLQRLILCLQRRNVSEDLVLLNLFLTICLPPPPPRRQ